MIRACFFDVFGTVVDWHTSVSRDLAEFAEERGVTGVDWVEFAEEWRKLYNPAMEEVRSGRREWTVLDVLHREGLVTLLARYGLEGFDEGEIDAMNRAWHRLDPWPDAVPGLLRLKARYVIAPCSNGNIALIVNMAKRAGLPWDVVLGAEPARAYKPEPEAYLASCRMLDLAPAEVLMVAAAQRRPRRRARLRPADRVRRAPDRARPRRRSGRRSHRRGLRGSRHEARLLRFDQGGGGGGGGMEAAPPTNGAPTS